MSKLAIALISLLLLGSGASPPSESESVSFARAVRVASIDSSLGSGLTLSEWITSRARDRDVIWESNDCGEQTGDPETTPQDFPICVSAEFRTCAGLPASIYVIVGTYRKGLAAPVEFYMAYTGSGAEAVDRPGLSAFARAAPVCTD